MCSAKLQEATPEAETPQLRAGTARSARTQIKAQASRHGFMGWLDVGLAPARIKRDPVHWQSFLPAHPPGRALRSRAALLARRDA
jgi:hypothetical protein